MVCIQTYKFHVHGEQKEELKDCMKCHHTKSKGKRFQKVGILVRDERTETEQLDTLVWRRTGPSIFLP